MGTTASIVVAHAGIGSGYRMVAEAVARELDTIAGTSARVTVLDAQELGPARFSGLPDERFWSPDARGAVARALTSWALPRSYRRFSEALAELRPDAVVCTHPLAATVAAKAVAHGRLRTSVIAVATNYGTPGPYPHRNVSLYCVGDVRSADELISAREIAEPDVALTGIPVRPQFTLEYDLAAAREHFSLPAARRTILALAGSTLPGPYEKFKEALAVSLPALASIPDTTVVIVTGRDDAFAEELKSRSAAFGVGNVHALGFVEHMAPLMSIADVALAIPGGVICAECASMGLPVVLMGPARGHERINAEVLVEAGLALYADDPRTIAEYTRKAITSTARLKRMSEATHALARPFAATDVAERVLKRLGVDVGEQA